MAITKTLIFNGVTINGTAYTFHLVDSAEVTVEPVTDTIDDGQTLTSAWDVSFAFKVYDDAVTTDTDIYTNASNTPVKAPYVRFDGAPGGATLNITNVIVNATPQFDENRVSYLLTGTKRVTTQADTITIA
jgi:hypothetical protein